MPAVQDDEMARGGDAQAVWHARWQAAGVRTAVLLASTCRSGSTRVAAALAVNGVPGLEKERFQQAWRYVGKPPLAAFAREGLAEVADGAFGTKMMWPHFVHPAHAMCLGQADAP